MNTGDAVVAGPSHRLFLADRGHGPHPYLGVRGRLEALVARPVFYELAAWALEEHASAEGAHPAGLWSDGAFFPLDAG